MNMRISKKVAYLSAISLLLVLAVIFAIFLRQTSLAFADGNQSTPSTAQPEGSSPSYFVNLYDQGKKLIIKTSVKTVREVLERAQISLNETDRVEPGLDAEINADNFFINVYRSSPVVLIDGSNKTYFLASSRDPKAIFHEAGITVYDGDEIRLVNNQLFLESGIATTYEIIRHGGRTITIEEEIPFAEETVKDYNLPAGTSEIRQYGEVGKISRVYEVFYVNNQETSRSLVSETISKNPTKRIVARGASPIEKTPLTAAMGRNRYTIQVNGQLIERQETYYDLDMSVVIGFCGSSYSVRADGAKVDQDGYVLVAAHLSRYPRCSVVETSLGPGKVYDTGSFATTNPEQFDLATDWTNRNGR